VTTFAICPLCDNHAALYPFRQGEACAKCVDKYTQPYTPPRLTRYGRIDDLIGTWKATVW
jgi:hypothetical protein